MGNFSDVIIIGGGPCGSFSALDLSKRGFDVIVFEEHSQIGVPCHCAGHISINGLKNLGLYPLPENVVENIFYGAKFYSPKGSNFSVRFTRPVSCTVNRILFDKHIANFAEKAGARYSMNSRVESLIIVNGHVKGVNVEKCEGKSKFFGKIVLDAEGISARILKQASLLPPRGDRFVNGVQAEVESVKNIESDVVEVFLGSEYALGFYAWLIPKSETEAKVGLATKIGNPKLLLQRLMRKHPVASIKLRGAKILQEYYHPITLGGPIPKTYSNGFLVVGDAASQVKPTTGGGIIFGLNSAKIAAEVVAEALNKNDFSAEFLGAYQKHFMRLFSFDLKVMLKIREMLDKLPDGKLDDVIRLCGRLHLDEVFKNLKEIDFQGRTLLKAVQNPRVLVAFASFSLNYLLRSFKPKIVW
ncbi:MAG: NAD(P)/FAD-dependent oxidoreductase [Candidatus Bathyarchaeia archaeon]